MARNKLRLVFACFALCFGLSQSAFSQWWPATGTDTDQNWGSGGWGSNVEIYIDQAPLAALGAPDPDCKLKPKDCKNEENFKPIFDPGDGTGFLAAAAPRLNGLRLEPFADCANPPDPYNATITGVGDITPPSIAVCIIRDDAGNLLPETAAYCEVNVGVNEVLVTNPGDECVYERTIGVPNDKEWFDGSAASIFTAASSVTLYADREAAGLPDDDPNFDDLTPMNIPGCATPPCTLELGLPTGVICPEKGQPNCRNNLFPSTELFDEGQVLLAREDRNIVALRYCVSDVNGERSTIACDSGDKQVETAEATVIIECTGAHSPSKDFLTQTGNNTHRFDYEANCFPELDTVEPNNTIEFETVVDGKITNPSIILPVNECQFGGDGPSSLSCFVLEDDLIKGCAEREVDKNDGVDGPYYVDAIRGKAMVDISEPGEDPKLVPLIATDDNGTEGYLCKDYTPPQ